MRERLDLIQQLCDRRLLELSEHLEASQIECLRALSEQVCASGVVTRFDVEAVDRAPVFLQWAHELTLAALAEAHTFVHLTVTPKLPTPMCVAADAAELTVNIRRRSLQALIRAKSFDGVPLTRFFACHGGERRSDDEERRFAALCRANRQALRGIKLAERPAGDEAEVCGAFWFAQIGGSFFGSGVRAEQWQAGAEKLSDRNSAAFWAGPLQPGAPILERFARLNAFLDRSLPRNRSSAALRRELAPLRPLLQS